MFASGSEIRVGYVPEAAWAQTPATPGFKTLRVTGGGLRTNFSVGTSDERIADRNVRDEYLQGEDASGTYNFELSYGTLDDILEAVMFGTWTGNVLKNGNTRRSFTFEETLETGATDSFFRFPGCMVNSLSMELSSRAAVTGSFNLMAKQEIPASAPVTGATYAAPTTTETLTASASVAAFDMMGTSPKVRRLQFEINNGLRTRPLIASRYSEEFGVDRCNISGTMEAYFEDNTLYQRVFNRDAGPLSFTVGNVSGEKYTFLFPNIKFGNGERSAPGNADDVILTLPFRALYSAPDAASLVITRAVA